MYVITVTDLYLLSKANKFLTKKGWTHKGRMYNLNILVYIKDGECDFYLNEKSYHLGKGSFIIIPKGVFYKPHTDSYCFYSYFHFSGEYLGEVSAKSDNIDNRIGEDGISSETYFVLPLCGKVSNKIGLYLDSAVEEANSILSGHKNRMNIAFLNALNFLTVDFASQDKNNLAGKVRQYITDNLTEHISLSDISSVFGYSNQHIINQFKRQFGTTPVSFIFEKRLELGATYLLETSLNVTEIAYECGFNDPNYFSRAFREKYNISPQKYRKYYQSA